MKYLVGDQVEFEGNYYRVYKLNGDIICISNCHSEAEVLEQDIELLPEDFRPFDYSFMLDNERAMLADMYRFFISDDPIVSDKLEIAKQIKLAIDLLNIIQEYDNVIYRSDDGKVTLNVYVNRRNLARFYPEGLGENPLLNNVLRQKKAWFLYNKLRYLYMRGWWD